MNGEAMSPYPRRAMNLSHLLRQNRRRFGDEIGFVQGDTIKRWAEIDARVDAMASALADRGVGAGTRVLVQSRNCLQMFESMFVCFRLGAIWVPVNYRQAPAEVAVTAKVTGATHFLCHRDHGAHAAAVTEATGARLIAIGKADFTNDDYEGLVEAYQDLPGPKDVEVFYDTPCWFFLTSGTSGRPKAAVLTHGQMGFVITNHLSDLMPGTTHRDAAIVVAPLSHGAGIHQLVQTARGAKAVLPISEGLQPEEVWWLVESWRVSNLFTVPTILKRLVEDPGVDRFDHSSLRYVIYAGAPIYRTDQRHALCKLGKVIVQYYGLGEVTGCITALPPELHEEDDKKARIGTCGWERTAMQVSIRDADGGEMPTGQDGEIWVCGPAVFAGYYNDHSANAAAFRDGWFRTGDIGRLDDNDFLFITGRASDMFISGGSNIYPVEVEDKIRMHPGVAEVAIIGRPDPVWGEIGVAYCVLAGDPPLDQPDIAKWLDGKIAGYKIPKKTIFVSELPKTAYGKIDKASIRKIDQ